MVQILLCDDSLPFAQALRQQLRQILDKEGREAAIWVYATAEDIPQDHLSRCDIFFLDIDFQKKHYNGMDIARRIRSANRNAIIIFVTNFVEYAQEGYEVQAFRYLLKDQIPQKLGQCLLLALQRLELSRHKIPLQSSGETLYFAPRDILYLESQGHTSLLWHQSQGKLQCTELTYPLGKLEQKLRQDAFLRVHKSYLVNMRRIRSFQSTALLLDNGTQLPVSRSAYNENKQTYLSWKGSQRPISTGEGGAL